MVWTHNQPSSLQVSAISKSSRNKSSRSGYNAWDNILHTISYFPFQKPGWKEIISSPSAQIAFLSPCQRDHIGFHNCKLQKLQGTGSWVLGNNQALANLVHPLIETATTPELQGWETHTCVYIHSLKEHLLNTYFVQGPGLSTGDIVGNHTDKILSSLKQSMTTNKTHKFPTPISKQIQFQKRVRAMMKIMAYEATESIWRGAVGHKLGQTWKLVGRKETVSKQAECVSRGKEHRSQKWSMQRTEQWWEGC